MFHLPADLPGHAARLPMPVFDCRCPVSPLFKPFCRGSSRISEVACGGRYRTRTCDLVRVKQGLQGTRVDWCGIL